MPLVRTEETIRGPPAIVWRHLVDSERYGEWNPLLGSFRGEFREGSDIRFKLNLGSTKLAIGARVVRAGDNELRWEGPTNKALARLAHGSHYFRLSASEEGTVLEHGEYFGGPAFELLWPFLRTSVESAYRKFNRALAERAEGTA